MKVFQLIPDRSVDNKKGAEFIRSLHDLFEPFYKRIQIKERRLQPLEKFWYIIRLTAEEITFHTACSENTEVYLQQRLSRYWPKAAIKESELPGMKQDDSLLCEMKYKRHNIFALSADWREDTVPIASILNVIPDMKEDDEARIVVCIEPYNRTTWADWSEKALQEFKDGKTPSRRGIAGKFTLKTVAQMLDNVMSEVEDVAQTIFDTESEVKERDRKRNKKRGDLEKRKILLDGKLDKATLSKQNEPVFKTHIYITSYSKHKERRLITLRSLSNAFSELAGDNELKRHDISPKTIQKLNEWKVPLDFDTNIMSASEVGKLWQLPTAVLQEKYKDLLQSTQINEVEIPKCFLDPSGVYTGTATVKSKDYDIHIPTKNPDKLMTARAFIGSPRQGKDQALANFIVESKRKHGIGSVLVDWIDEHSKDKDGHQRGLSDAVRDSLEPNDFIDIDFSNYDWAVYLGLQPLIQSIGNARIASDAISKEITSFLMGEDMDHHTTREYLRDAAKVCAGDWLDIKRMFADSEFRKEKIERMEQTNIGDVAMWESFHQISDQQRAQIFAPVNVRMGEILNDEILKPIFCQKPNPKVDLIKWIQEGKVVIFRMKVSEMSKKILAHFVTMLTFLIKLGLDGKGACTWLILNEPHQIETKDFCKFIKRILVEGPKYKLAPVLAFHHLGAGHLSREFVDTLAAANLSWHMFYNSNVQTYEKLKAYIEPTFTPETAMKQTPQFHFIAAGWRDDQGVTQVPFMLHAPDRVKDRWGAKDHSEITKRHSKTYGRPIDDVLREFRERNRTFKKRTTEIQIEPQPETNELFDEAVRMVLENQQASVSLLQRKLKIGYTKATQIIDQMEEKGIVGPFEGSKPRKVLIQK